MQSEQSQNTRISQFSGWLHPRIVLVVLLLLGVAATWWNTQKTIQQVYLGFYHDGERVQRVLDTQLGVREGDRLRSIDGHSMRAHGRILRQRQGQGTITFDIERQGQTLQIPITLQQHLQERRHVWIYGIGVLLLFINLLVLVLPHPTRKRWGALVLVLLSAALFVIYLLTVAPLTPTTIRFLFWIFAVALGSLLFLNLSRHQQRSFVRVLSLIVALFIGITTSTELIYPAIQSGYDGLDAQWDPEKEEATISSISTFGLTSAPGALAGVRVGDRLVSVNGHALNDDYVTAHQAWEGRLLSRRTTTYQIRRGTDTQTIQVQDERLPGTIQWALVSRATAVFIFLIASSFVFWRMPLDPKVLVFGGLSYAFVALVRLLDQPPMVYGIDAPVIVFLDTPIKIWLLVAASNGPAMFLHFLWLFPERKGWLDRYPGLSYLIYAPGLWITVGFLHTMQRFGHVTALPWMRWMVLGYFLLASFSMMSSYRGAKQRRIKKQIKFAFLAVLASTLIVLVGGIWSYSKIGQAWASKTFIATWGLIPVAFGYAIIRHRAMNLNLIIRRSLIYTTLSVLIAAGWIVLYYGVFQWMLSMQHNQGMLALGMALGIGFLMPRLEKQVRSTIDRTFFREDYDYQQTLREFSRALASVIDLQTLLQMSVREVYEVMHVSRACVLLQEEEDSQFTPAAWRGVTRAGLPQFESDGPFARLLCEQGHPITIEELERHQRAENITEAELASLLSFDTELCVPLLFQGALKGIFLLGPKLSEDAYSREDMNLLSTLADQAAITLENTRLYEVQWEQDRIKQELANAQRIQRAILPETDPTPKNLELASFFQPATEVGGDYFDYLEIDEHRFALAVGDVAGHGLDAGLMVSMAKSCFYTTTRDISDDTTAEVEDVMRVMNDMVCEVRARMLMTFALAVFESGEPGETQDVASLTLANAGHPFPYHLRASGQIESIEAGAYPLGVRRNMAYPHYQRTLEPGDLLVFYSDGIIEATNRNREQVGFKRFEKILRNAPKDSARACRDEILRQLKHFCQEVPFVDDVTLILVRYLGHSARTPTLPQSEAL